MIDRKTLTEFKDSGLLWFINNILHAFGWAIVIELDSNIMYPARVKFRGFNEESNTKGYINVSKYMVENCEALLEEANE